MDRVNQQHMNIAGENVSQKNTTQGAQKILEGVNRKSEDPNPDEA
jgi:hypothetical protein